MEHWELKITKLWWLIDLKMVQTTIFSNIEDIKSQKSPNFGNILGKLEKKLLEITFFEH